MAADRVVLASSNRGKLRELQKILHQENIALLPQSEFGVTDAEETGLPRSPGVGPVCATYAEVATPNAIAKTVAFLFAFDVILSLAREAVVGKC